MFGEEGQVRSKSGNVVSERYDPDEHILRIKYRSGRSWDYHGVDGPLYKSFKEAPQQGEFLKKIVVPSNPAREVTG